MLDIIKDIFFPPTCVICGKVGRWWICPKCKIHLKPELKFFRIKRKKNRILFVSFYEGRLRKLLLQFKFQEKSYIGNFFAEVISRNKKFTGYLKEYDYMIPVPMYKENEKERGYNQAELITKEISRRIGIKYTNGCLIKIKPNQKQSRLNETQRIEHVQGVYEVQNGDIIKNKKILLVDDIYTTGSTVRACIRELRKANPKQIDILVMAKTK